MFLLCTVYTKKAVKQTKYFFVVKSPFQLKRRFYNAVEFMLQNRENISRENYHLILNNHERSQHICRLNKNDNIHKTKFNRSDDQTNIDNIE